MEWSGNKGISSAASDIKIQAKSIDITEANFENFEQLQKKKLLEILFKIRKLIPIQEHRNLSI